jgi:hypothetical protein
VPLDEHHQAGGGRYNDRQQHTDLAVWRPYWSLLRGQVTAHWTPTNAAGNRIPDEYDRDRTALRNENAARASFEPFSNDPSHRCIRIFNVFRIDYWLSIIDHCSFFFSILWPIRIGFASVSICE